MAVPGLRGNVGKRTPIRTAMIRTPPKNPNPLKRKAKRMKSLKQPLLSRLHLFRWTQQLHGQLEELRNNRQRRNPQPPKARRPEMKMTMKKKRMRIWPTLIMLPQRNLKRPILALHPLSPAGEKGTWRGPFWAPRCIIIQFQRSEGEERGARTLLEAARRREN